MVSIKGEDTESGGSGDSQTSGRDVVVLDHVSRPRARSLKNINLDESFLVADNVSHDTRSLSVLLCGGLTSTVQSYKQIW